MSNGTKPKASAIDKLVGENLKNLRRGHDLSLDALGSYIDKSHQQVQKYEKGQDRVAASTLHKISKVFKVTTDYFFQKHCDREKQPSMLDFKKMGVAEHDIIEYSLNRQIDRHKDWICEAAEAEIKYTFDQQTANSYYKTIKRISTKRIIEMGQKALKRLTEASNDDEGKELFK